MLYDYLYLTLFLLLALFGMGFALGMLFQQKQDRRRRSLEK